MPGSERISLNQIEIMKSINKLKLSPNKELASFVNHLCHELATPLSLLLSVDEINRDTLSESDLLNVKDVSAAKDSLLSLLNELKKLRHSIKE